MELKRSGETYQAIAEVLGYADRSAARRTYIRALQRALVEDASEMRLVENDRLDRLQLGHWEKALRGDEKAAGVVLKIMDRRAKLNGLDVPTKVEHSGPAGNPLQVVIDPSLLPDPPAPDDDGTA